MSIYLAEQRSTAEAVHSLFCMIEFSIIGGTAICRPVPLLSNGDSHIRIAGMM